MVPVAVAASTAESRGGSASGRERDGRKDSTHHSGMSCGVPEAPHLAQVCVARTVSLQPSRGQQHAPCRSWPTLCLGHDDVVSSFPRRAASSRRRARAGRRGARRVSGLHRSTSSGTRARRTARYARTARFSAGTARHHAPRSLLLSGVLRRYPSLAPVCRPYGAGASDAAALQRSCAPHPAAGEACSRRRCA